MYVQIDMHNNNKNTLERSPFIKNARTAAQKLCTLTGNAISNNNVMKRHKPLKSTYKNRSEVIIIIITNED